MKMITLGPRGTFVDYETKDVCWSRNLPQKLYNNLNGRYNNSGQQNSAIQALAYSDSAFIIGYKDGGGRMWGDIGLDWDDIGTLEFATMGPNRSWLIIGSKGLFTRNIPRRMKQLLKTRSQGYVVAAALGNSGGFFLLYSDGTYYYGGGINQNLRDILGKGVSVKYLSMFGSNYFLKFENGSSEWCGPTRLTNHVKASTHLCHRSILYSQESIASTFSDGGSVRGLARDLEASRVHVEDVPLIRVVRVDGCFYSLDNRRLNAFSRAGVNKIPVEIVTPSHALKERIRNLRNRGQRIRVRGWENYEDDDYDDYDDDDDDDDYDDGYDETNLSYYNIYDW